MSCCATHGPIVRDLNPVYSGATWPGLTCVWTSAGTAFQSALTLVEFTVKDADGTDVVAITSADTSAIEINADWDYTIKPRAFALTAGVYSWAIRETAANGEKTIRLAGTLPIKANPI